MNPVSRWLITAWYRWKPARPARDDDRGDVPGWVLITLMTAALVVAIWTIADERLKLILNSALDKINGI